jgi:FG-GAP-like repeat
MKYFFGAFSLLGIATLLFISCENQAQKEERLARQHCSSCHVFTEPSLLDKKSWEKGVLPEMAFRMGFLDMNIISSFSPEDLNEITKVIPQAPMLSEADLQSIKNYYLTHAPDSLPSFSEREYDSISTFHVQDVSLPFRQVPLITLLKKDTIHRKLFLGTRMGQLYQLNYQFAVEDSFPLTSPVSHILFQKGEPPIMTAMGIMDPNDQAKGSLQLLLTKEHATQNMIDSLKRPVHFEKADLNGDGLEDYVICAFGNYTGALLTYENLGNGKYRKHSLLSLPGARKVVVDDFTRDGLKDVLVLMTQGDEQISLLKNTGRFNFKINTLLRFPPVYGSSYFDVIDFNKDGHFDMVYTNGDNADYSAVLKPYHGVRVFINNGKNEFKEEFFLPMSGASQAVARDFDKDGDVDIAAISFFPRFKYAAEGFIYFENNGKGFTPQVTSLASAGRWLVMENTDLDGNGYEDIVLGALDFNNGVPISLLDQWKNKKTSLLVFYNKGK